MLCYSPSPVWTLSTSSTSIFFHSSPPIISSSLRNRGQSHAVQTTNTFVDILPSWKSLPSRFLPNDVTGGAAEIGWDPTWRIDTHTNTQKTHFKHPSVGLMKGSFPQLYSPSWTPAALSLTHTQTHTKTKLSLDPSGSPLFTASC